MYDIQDTIAVVSSPAEVGRVIVRVTGPEVIEKVGQVFSPLAKEFSAGVICGKVTVDDELLIDAHLYLFLEPHSYTGQTLAEIHMDTNSSVTGAVMDRLFSLGVRMAGPGEFTARAYLNGKIDLAQAEAVNEVIVSTNEIQLAAAEKLLSGRLAEKTGEIQEGIMDCLSLVEAAIDFSSQDIEFISAHDLNAKLSAIVTKLRELLDGSISFETVVDLPSVGIAGAPNAGKSSLLNTILGRQRSIVSGQRKTTRDVLTGVGEFKNSRCVLFDCAGLIVKPTSIIDSLAQNAAVEALRGALLVLFCVDLSKDDWADEAAHEKRPI